MNINRGITLALALAASLSRDWARWRRLRKRTPRRCNIGRSPGRSAPTITAQLQRGFKIYREVCSNCHSLKLLSFRNLAEPGGPDFTEAQAAAIAASYQVTDGPNDQGQMFQRPGRISDSFPPPFRE